MTKKVMAKDLREGMKIIRNREAWEVVFTTPTADGEKQIVESVDSGWKFHTSYFKPHTLVATMPA